MDDWILETESEISRLAALACRRVRLVLAFAAAGGAFDADMEMIIVAVHRPDFGEPTAVALGFAAQRLLDGGVDEDALHGGLLRRGADQRKMAGRPHGR